MSRAIYCFCNAAERREGVSLIGFKRPMRKPKWLSHLRAAQTKWQLFHFGNPDCVTAFLDIAIPSVHDAKRSPPWHKP
jgi:hypothetical protein